jgi:ubiquinone biosynthesis protein UbiJ
VSLVAAGLEVMLNRYLCLDPESLARLEGLNGKIFAWKVSDLNLVLYVLPSGSELRISAETPAEPDVTIHATVATLLRLGRGDRVPGDQLEIEGDTELAGDLRDVLSGIDIDWEEQLSGLVGDVVAHRLGNLARGVLGWGHRAKETLLRDASEYLQQESQDLPRPEAVEGFLDGVDRLRNDVDRLEARIGRLRLRQQISHDDA